MEKWLALLKSLPQDLEQLEPFINAQDNFIEYLQQEYLRLTEVQRREVERNLATRKGLKFIDLLGTHKNPAVRRWGLELTGLLPGEMRTPRLFRAFDDNDEEIKFAAAEKLGCLCSLEVVNALLQALREGRWVPARIAHSLSRMGNFCVPHLTELSKEDNVKLKVYAVEILVLIGSEKSAQAIINFLTDSSSAVRRAVIRALEQIPLQQCAPALVEALAQEQDKVTKLQLIRTITRLRLIQAIPVLEQQLAGLDPQLAQAAGKALDILNQVREEQI